MGSMQINNGCNFKKKKNIHICKIITTKSILCVCESFSVRKWIGSSLCLCCRRKSTQRGPGIITQSVFSKIFTINRIRHPIFRHYSDVKMSAMASQITAVPTNCLLRRRSKKTSKLRVTAFVRGIHRSSVDSHHKGPVTRKTFPFDDVIMVLNTNSDLDFNARVTAVLYELSCYITGPLYNDTRRI